MPLQQVNVDTRQEAPGPLVNVLRAAGLLLGKNKLERDTTVPGDTNPEQPPQYKTGFWDTIYGNRGALANQAAEAEMYNRAAAAREAIEASRRRMQEQEAGAQAQARANIFQKKEFIPLEKQSLENEFSVIRAPSILLSGQQERETQGQRLGAEAGMLGTRLSAEERMLGTRLASEAARQSEQIASTEKMHSAGLANRLKEIAASGVENRATHEANAIRDTIELAKRGDANAIRELDFMEASIPIESRRVFQNLVARGNAESVNAILGLYRQGQEEKIRASGDAGPTAMAEQAAKLSTANIAANRGKTAENYYTSEEGQEAYGDILRNKDFGDRYTFHRTHPDEIYQDPRSGQWFSFGLGKGPQSRMLPNYATRKAAADATERRLQESSNKLDTGLESDKSALQGSYTSPTAETPTVAAPVAAPQVIAAPAGTYGQTTAVTPGYDARGMALGGKDMPSYGSQLLHGYKQNIGNFAGGLKNFAGGINRRLTPTTAEVKAATEEGLKRWMENR